MEYQAKKVNMVILEKGDATLKEEVTDPGEEKDVTAPGGGQGVHWNLAGAKEVQ